MRVAQLHRSGCVYAQRQLLALRKDSRIDGSCGLSGACSVCVLRWMCVEPLCLHTEHGLLGQWEAELRRRQITHIIRQWLRLLRGAV
jgi:hypothetical protein